MSLQDLVRQIRPANMHVVHGFRRDCDGWNYSVSAAECVEGTLADPNHFRETGSGMDAPDEIPCGSVKAWFDTYTPGRLSRLIGWHLREVRTVANLTVYELHYKGGVMAWTN